MDVLVVADGHYYITPDGSVFADSVYDYNFYKRYLQGFDHVYAAVRAEEISNEPIGKKKSSGDHVSFLRLPNYRGPLQYLLKYLSIRKYVKKYCSEYKCAIFRIPAATSNIFCRFFSKTGKPFAVEVVTDPWENFGQKADGNILMNILVRIDWTCLVIKMCKKANGVSYVTKRYLQKKYPPRTFKEPKCNAFTAAYSSVELDEDKFAVERQWFQDQRSFMVSHVSNDFNTYGKGHLTLMNAVKIVNEKGHDVRIRFVGDGPKRKEFEEYARRLGIFDKVEFTGRLANGDEVRKAIRFSDLFVLPTFAEGLPRVLLEAMAEGIPCLSSPVCGIPEILDDKYLFDFSDALGFAAGIEAFITNPLIMNHESKHNIEVAKQFSNVKLNAIRRAFYMDLRRITEKGEI